MNIAIDVQPLVSPGSKNRGIGNYTKSQLQLLLEKDKVNKYFLFNIYTEESIFTELGIDPADYPNVEEFKLYTGNNQYIIQKLSNGMIKEYDDLLGSIITKFIKDFKIDIFYLTSPFDHWDIFNIDWYKETKVITTVYDVIPLIFKDRYLRDKELHKWYMRIIEFIKKADRILAISQSVKTDLIKYCRIDSEKIDVIYAGIDSRFKKTDLEKTTKQNILDKYGISQKFIMCTGGDDPRKNMRELIQAFSSLPQNIKSEYQLVIVCSLDVNGHANLMEVINKFNVKGKVILTNFVPFEHLVMLYNMAYLMAFPSQYEGFGLPVVEAMACGTPVLTSNNSSLGEIAEGAAVLVDPFSVDSIKTGLIKALTNEDLYQLVVNSKEKVEKFTWENTVKATIQSIETVRVKISSKEYSLKAGIKKKIAFFTPLPPLQSGISDYSYDILEGLCKYFDIDVYVDDANKKYEVPQADNIRVLNHKNYRNNKNEYFETIYQIGNSEFHIYMFPYVKAYGGLVVLHDYNLHGVIHFMTGGKNDYKGYQEYLALDYPNEVKQYMESLLNGKTGLKIYEMPSNGIVSNYADRIIVHSDYAKRGLLKRDISRNVKKINLYAKIEDKTDKLALRNKYNIKQDDIIVASFGFIASTKRIDKALEAFALAYEKNESIKYFLVGEPNTEMKEYINKFCEDSGLGENIVVTGFTDLSAFKDYINMADICINLRYPYNGETSASLMQILAAGKAVIVSDIGSFSEVPDNCCIKVPVSLNDTDDSEVKAIYNALEKLITDKCYLDTISSNAREFAKENLDIEKIAKQYADFMNEKKRKIINEKLLETLFEREIIRAPNIEREARLISETLGYLK